MGQAANDAPVSDIPDSHCLARGPRSKHPLVWRVQAEKGVCVACDAIEGQLSQAA